MKRTTILFITAVNCLLVVGMMVVTFARQDPKPSPSRIRAAAPDATDPGGWIERINDPDLSDPDRILALRALPPSAMTDELFRQLLAETEAAPQTLTGLNMENLACAKRLRNVTVGEAAWESLTERIFDPGRSIAHRDFLLRETLLVAVEGLGNTTGDPAMVAADAVQALLRRAGANTHPTLRATALAGLSYLAARMPEQVEREALLEAVRDGLRADRSEVHRIAAALEAVARNRLSPLRADLTALLTPDQPEVILAGALRALQQVGGIADIPAIARVRNTSPTIWREAAVAIEWIQNREKPAPDPETP